MEKTVANHYDVVIIGGGLAGSTLAIQLIKRSPTLRLLILEKASYPVKESAHKVGESSVEIGSFYFEHELDLAHLLDQQLPKLGLRFFYTQGNNQDICTRMELGPSDFPAAKSYQLDRGQFENNLVKECQKLGITFQSASRVRALQIEKYNHQITYVRQNDNETVNCTWIVDASGRFSVLKHTLKLSKPSSHKVNAAWFRLDHNIDVDEWSQHEQWHGRVKSSRRLSTNHLMGKGYWVWLIPLVSGATSIGIVADDKLHDFSDFNRFDKALTWLQKHEPQCAKFIEQNQKKLLDFRALKHFAHNCKQLFSADGWCITGDAGVFLDPFYSPGSDFIAINNSVITQLIIKQQQGHHIDAEVAFFENQFRMIYLGFMPTYQDQYPIMGHAQVMSIKVLWDFLMYWSGIGLLFFSGKLIDSEFMDKAKTHLMDYYRLNLTMQACFRAWAEKDDFTLQICNQHIDYTQIKHIYQMNEKLLTPVEDGKILPKLEHNYCELVNLAHEISSEADMALDIPPASKKTTYFQQVFSVFHAPVS